ncbi:NRDE protein-domain-containing protein [Crepidotus variabilis]|uniref:NRDE protein-domain-containing protein n=1 Tax=Crepidotus variabilis TaxID=179855 RepID=A0A9P6EEJ6_9AGAR|nr:NRDE protein-domain-containing protein [Crepidotus variabilis]
MCIGVWTLEHAKYALIICTNRDEFLDRPTQNAHYHSFASNSDPNLNDCSGPILSGRDVQAGGSWFGINKLGRAALLTNITEPAHKYKTSRGSLVSSFLLSESLHPLEGEIGQTQPEDANYAGFNLLLLAPTVKVESGAEPIQYTSLRITNHGGGGTLTSRPLEFRERSCGCISNGVDHAGADQWPKVQHATNDFDRVLRSLSPDTTETELTEELFNVLTWHPEEAIKERKQLRNTIQVVPVPIVLDGPAGNPRPTYYGTRLSTVLLVARNGDVLFVERDIWQLGPEGKPYKADRPSDRTFRFTIDKSNLSSSSS